MKIRKLLARQDKKNGEIRIYLDPENKDIDYKELFHREQEKQSEDKGETVAAH